MWTSIPKRYCKKFVMLEKSVDPFLTWGIIILAGDLHRTMLLKHHEARDNLLYFLNFLDYLVNINYKVRTLFFDVSL
jgi:hypothetical protein